ncbi:NAD(P)H-dependent oxidoreductase [Tabrizicola sp.]|uniref:NAD(P)H-dependent oxidoreductase n=1 Tax=Tabrizicola sp. TaxID=2005166 RepID=UPI003F3A6872
MTRALVIYAHPCNDSFAAALRDTVTGTLSTRGWKVDLCDLYAEKFDPVMSAEERRGYHDLTSNTRPVQTHVDRLRAAEALIFVHPVWNFGFPAILKGYTDRVFLPGISFRLDNGKVKPAMTHIRKLASVTTYGADRLRAFLAGDPPRRVVSRAFRHACQPDKFLYMALYDMNRADAARRADYLARVRSKMEHF